MPNKADKIIELLNQGDKVQSISRILGTGSRLHPTPTLVLIQEEVGVLYQAGIWFTKNKDNVLYKFPLSADGLVPVTGAAIVETSLETKLRFNKIFNHIDLALATGLYEETHEFNPD